MSIAKALIGGAVLIGGVLVAKRIINKNGKVKESINKKKEEFNQKWEDFRKKEKAETLRKGEKLARKAKEDLFYRVRAMRKADRTKKESANKEVLRTVLAEAFRKAQERQSKIHMKSSSTMH